MKFVKIATLTGLLATGSALAAPELVNYQGFVTDANGISIGAGNPVNREIYFRVYDAPSGGNLLWSESHTTTIADGRFSVLLGNGGQVGTEAKPNLNSLFASGAAFYVGITVDANNANGASDDSEISPRQRIVSSVFALRAATADSVASGQDLSLANDSGLGFYDSTRQFNGQTINGPVLFGSGGGALGSLNAGASNLALRWDNEGDISVVNNLTLGSSSSLRLSDQPLYLRGGTDENHGLIWRNLNDIDGPNLFGFNGGALGFANNGVADSTTNALTWQQINNDTATVSINGNFVTSGASTFTGLGTFNGGLTSTGQINTSSNLRANGGLYLFSSDENHGIQYFNEFAGRSVNGPAVYGFSGGILGAVNGTESAGTPNTQNWALQWFSGGGVLVNGDLTVDSGSLTTKGPAEIEGKLLVESKSVPNAEESLRIVRGSLGGRDANGNFASTSVLKVYNNDQIAEGIKTYDAPTTEVRVFGPLAVTFNIRGDGYKVQKIADDSLKILFDTPFSDIPTVTATVKLDNGQIGTRQFIKIYEVTTSHVTLRVNDDDSGNGGSTALDFIAIGPR